MKMQILFFYRNKFVTNYFLLLNSRHAIQGRNLFIYEV